MIEQETIIDGKTVRCQPWGFFTLMERKRRLLKLMDKSKAQILGLFSGDTDADDLTAIVEIVSSIVESFDEKTLKWFIETMLETVTVDGNQMCDAPTRDLVLAGSSGLFYQIVIHVLKVNFGDFLELLTKMKSETTSES